MSSLDDTSRFPATVDQTTPDGPSEVLNKKGQRDRERNAENLCPRRSRGEDKQDCAEGDSRQVSTRVDHKKLAHQTAAAPRRSQRMVSTNPPTQAARALIHTNAGSLISQLTRPKIGAEITKAAPIQTTE